MIKKVVSVINEHDMIQEGDHIIVGLSGGSDSIALIHTLNSISKEMQFCLTAVHVNHNLRGEEALRDEKLCAEFCKSLDIPIEIYSMNVPNFAKENKMTFEEAGRTVRYQCFEDALRGKNANKIAVAHNADDHIETVLMNFFRGSGISGLCGIPTVRDNIIRPLLHCTKEEIDHYCTSNGLEYIVDSTNSSTDYMRNKIRLELIPYLEKEINQGIAHNIKRLSDIAFCENNYMEEEAQKAFHALSQIEKDKTTLDLSKFNALHKALKLRIARIAYESLSNSLKDFTLKHAELLTELAYKGTGKQLSLPGEITADISYNYLVLKKDVHKNFTNIPLYENELIQIGESPYYISLSKDIPLEKENFSNTCTGVFNYDKIVGSLFLRNRLPGDKIYLKSIHGSKKIKDYFIDSKVDRTKRDEILMIADEQGNVLWILDHNSFVSDKFKYNGGSEKFYIQLWRRTNE